MKRGILTGVVVSLIFAGVALYAAYAQGNDDRQPSLKNAMQLSREGKNDEAIAVLKEVIRRAPVAARSARMHLGFLYFKSARYDNALDEFNAAIALDRDMPQAYYFMGLIYEAKAKADRQNEGLFERKALDAWENVLACPDVVNQKPQGHPKGVTVKEAVEQAKRHVAKLKEELRNEQK